MATAVYPLEAARYEARPKPRSRHGIERLTGAEQSRILTMAPIAILLLVQNERIDLIVAGAYGYTRLP